MEFNVKHQLFPTPTYIRAEAINLLQKNTRLYKGEFIFLEAQWKWEPLIKIKSSILVPLGEYSIIFPLLNLHSLPPLNMGILLQ